MVSKKFYSVRSDVAARNERMRLYSFSNITKPNTLYILPIGLNAIEIQPKLEKITHFG